MNLVIKKRQNSNSRIVGLLGRASLEGFLIKCLPEGGGRSIQPRAVGPVRRLLLWATKGPRNQQVLPCWSWQQEHQESQSSWRERLPQAPPPLLGSDTHPEKQLLSSTRGSSTQGEPGTKTKHETGNEERQAWQLPCGQYLPSTCSVNCLLLWTKARGLETPSNLRLGGR